MDHGWGGRADVNPYEGDIPWGTHFCHLYRTKAELFDAMVPYFKAGLARNEQCVWLTSGAVAAPEATALVAAAVPELAAERRAQLEIVGQDEWYGDSTDVDGALERWILREEQAIAAGFEGLRIAGDTSCLARHNGR